MQYKRLSETREKKQTRNLPISSVYQEPPAQKPEHNDGRTDGQKTWHENSIHCHHHLKQSINMEISIKNWKKNSENSLNHVYLRQIPLFAMYYGRKMWVYNILHLLLMQVLWVWIRNASGKQFQWVFMFLCKNNQTKNIFFLTSQLIRQQTWKKKS